MYETSLRLWTSFLSENTVKNIVRREGSLNHMVWTMVFKQQLEGAELQLERTARPGESDEKCGGLVSSWWCSCRIDRLYTCAAVAHMCVSHLLSFV